MSWNKYIDDESDKGERGGIERCPKCGGDAYPHGYCFACGTYWPGLNRGDFDPEETNSVGNRLRRGFELAAQAGDDDGE